jgi:MFS family permease
MGSSQPFIAVYAAQLGATPTELGFLHATMNLTTNAAQLIWGSFSDAVGRRVPFLIIGGLLSAALWPLALMTSSPSAFVLLMAVKFAFYSMTLPTFTALIADVTEPDERTRETVRINTWSTVGAALATSLVAAVHLMGLNGYLVGFAVAMVAELASALVLLGFREQRVAKRWPFISMVNEITANAPYFQFLLLNMLYIFFMSIAWPLFTITVTRVAKLDLAVIAALNVRQRPGLDGRDVRSLQGSAGPSEIRGTSGAVEGRSARIRPSAQRSGAGRDQRHDRHHQPAGEHR